VPAKSAAPAAAVAGLGTAASVLTWLDTHPLAVAAIGVAVAAAVIAGAHLYKQWRR
jgi:hypothetical protein